MKPHTFFVKIITCLLPLKIEILKTWATSVIFKKTCPNHPIGETSPNLATLILLPIISESAGTWGAALSQTDIAFLLYAWSRTPIRNLIDFLQ
jgi:hypothetical protein